MSTNVPPDGPADYLDSGSGSPRASRGGRPRRTLLAAGGAVAALALVGGGAWAAWWWFATGPQPAEALPADTLGYVAVDLDPDGAQKVEVLRTLRRFPALREELGIESDDDVRERIFEELRGELGCDELDYAADVEPWLGDRMAAAAVEVDDEPAAVFVLQVGDDDAAREGIDAFEACAGGEVGVVVDDGWAVVAETDAIAEGVVADAAESSLADDAEFGRWTDAAGGDALATGYVAAGAGRYLAELAEVLDPAGFGVGGLTTAGGDGGEGAGEFEDFAGAALTLRFADGALEVEAATGSGEDGSLPAGDGVAELAGSLPEDTAAVLGIGFAEGWMEAVLEQVEAASGGLLDVEEMRAEIADLTGLELPGDVEALLGDAAVLAVGADLDPEVALESPDGSDVPVGLKLRGDAEEMQRVVDRLRDSVGGVLFGTGLLDSNADGDTLAVGPNADYRARLLEDGDLGESDVFEDVVREERAGALLFVDFDAGDWLARLVENDPEAAENLEPLAGVGLTVWTDDAGDGGPVSHALLRITTN